MPGARSVVQAPGAQKLPLVAKTKAEAQGPPPQQPRGRSLHQRPAYLSPRQKDGARSPSSHPEELVMRAPRGLERSKATRPCLQGMLSVRRTITCLCRRRRWSSTIAWEETTCFRPWKTSCPIPPSAECLRPWRLHYAAQAGHRLSRHPSEGVSLLLLRKPVELAVLLGPPLS